MKNKIKSLRVALMLLFFVSLFSVIMVILILTTISTRSDAIKSATTYNTQIHKQIKNQLDSYIKYMKSLADIMAWDSQIQNFILNPDVSSFYKNRISLQFSSIYKTRPDIANLIIIGNNGSYLINDGSEALSISQNYKNDAWYKSTYEANGGLVLSTPRTENIIANNKEKVVSVSKLIKNNRTGEPIGIFIIELDFNSIINLIKDVQIGENSYTYLVSQEGNYIYNPMPELLENAESRITQKTKKGVGRNERIYLPTRLIHSNWTVISVIYVDDLISQQNRTITINIIISIIIFTIVFFLIYTITNKLFTPLKKIEKKMRLVRDGDKSFEPIEISASTEVQSMAESFNAMLKAIEELIKKEKEQADSKRRLELAMLQEQIKPHFIYNTLDSIIWMCAMNRTKEIMIMTSCLSKLLRKNISNMDEAHTLKEEIEYLQNYLKIQEIRYPNKLHYKINLEHKVENYKIIKLLIQPLVENAIYHGLKPKEAGGTICIDIREHMNTIKITVKDDGVGFNPDKFRIKEKSIGIFNILKRIEFYYGEGFIPEINSNTKQGTTITLTIPKCD